MSHIIQFPKPVTPVEQEIEKLRSQGLTAKQIETAIGLDPLIDAALSLLNERPRAFAIFQLMQDADEEVTGPRKIDRRTLYRPSRPKKSNGSSPSSL